MPQVFGRYPDTFIRGVLDRATNKNHFMNMMKKAVATRHAKGNSAIGVFPASALEYLEQIWTGVCPIFGIKIVLTGSLSDSNYANLDRIDPKLGYIKGNVQWLSARANRLKNNMTIDELKRLYECLVK
jgi:hypothetical protein